MAEMPRHPTPSPRTLPQLITRHGRSQAARRGISEVQIRDTIISGREIATEEAGQKGGFISKFYKTFVENDGAATMSKTVVAVCEVFENRYVLLTAYQEGTRSS